MTRYFGLSVAGNAKTVLDFHNVYTGFLLKSMNKDSGTQI